MRDYSIEGGGAYAFFFVLTPNGSHRLGSSNHRSEGDDSIDRVHDDGLTKTFGRSLNGLFMPSLHFKSSSAVHSLQRARFRLSLICVVCSHQQKWRYPVTVGSLG